jgi:hypothetical protein
MEEEHGCYTTVRLYFSGEPQVSISLSLPCIDVKEILDYFNDDVRQTHMIGFKGGIKVAVDENEYLLTNMMMFKKADGSFKAWFYSYSKDKCGLTSTVFDSLNHITRQLKGISV